MNKTLKGTTKRKKKEKKQHYTDKEQGNLKQVDATLTLKSNNPISKPD